MKNAFIKWSKVTLNSSGNIFDENRINDMINKLSYEIPDKLNEIDTTTDNKNLFQMTNINDLVQIKNRMSIDHKDFNHWNNNRWYSRSLHRYIKFLSETNLGNLNNNERTDTKSMKTKNIMLYGAPGVGKTYNYKKLITMIEEGNTEKEIFKSISLNEEITNQYDDTFQNIKDDKRIEFVAFHQSYSYEDFIEGFRPNKEGSIKLEDGVFKSLVNEALKDEEKNFYIVIDEINRGNISKIFGELITLIEEDNRDSYEVTLLYSKENFKLPSNLYIIATMNSTDKSIATIDIVLRRRFTFLKMEPNSSLVKDDNAKQLMEELNQYISKSTLGKDSQLGHSYFMKIENDEDLEFVKEYKIKPLLEEYFYSDEKSSDDIISLAKKEYKTKEENQVNE